MNHNEEDFKKEVTEIVKLLTQIAHGLKRKASNFDNTLQGLLEPAAKRVHSVLGDQAVPVAE